jgi:hypothetical protein
VHDNQSSPPIPSSIIRNGTILFWICPYWIFFSMLLFPYYKHKTQ